MQKEPRVGPRGSTLLRKEMFERGRGQLSTKLLGMSFLNRLESWEVRDKRLIM